MPALLEITALSAGYGQHVVLHDVNLVVPEGQLLCVLGPSGGGKSTLLRVIAGLEPPLRGSIRLAGHDLAGVQPHEREVGLMFQDYALFPHRDVGQNVAFGPRMAGVNEGVARARVAELLELVGLAGMERRRVEQLSGGEQQRVALARALAPRPRLLMLDEPMGSLDRSLRERLPEELREIFSDLGLTVVYVTHDQDEALSVADRVVVLDSGRIVADGSPEEIWTRPPSAWVARFLGFRNVASGRLVGSELVTPWGRLPASVPAGSDNGAGADEEVTVVLRAADIVPAVGGPIHGTVKQRRFRGDHVLLWVEVPDAPTLQVEARESPLPAIGEAVRLTVRRGGVHVVSESGTVPSGHE